MNTEKELIKLIREAVKAQTTNSEVLKSMHDCMEKLEQNMCNVNDQFVLHNQATIDTGKSIGEIKSELLKWLKWAIIFIVVLLGGIPIAKLLGFDLINLINSLGN